MESIPVRHMKRIPNEPDFSDSFSIWDLQDLLTVKGIRGDMVQELHRHNYFYVLVLKKGEGRHEIDFTSYPVTDNSVFFIRPGQVHQIVLKAGSIGYLLQFRNEFYFNHDHSSGQLLRKASQVNHYQFDSGGMKRLLTTLEDGLREYTEKKERYQESIRANMGIFFIELIRLQSSHVADPIKPYVQEKIEQFSELLERHIFDHKQVSQYAEKLSLSVYQLNTITRTTMDKTCSELINEHIILEAKRYLMATSNQVNQIAYHLGYEDVSYFIRFFKKHTGHSPESFRHNFK